MRSHSVAAFSLLTLAACAPASDDAPAQAAPTPACIETVNNMALIDWVPYHSSEARDELGAEVQRLASESGLSFVRVDDELLLLASSRVMQGPEGEYTQRTPLSLGALNGTSMLGGQRRTYSYPQFIGFQPQNLLSTQRAGGQPSFGLVAASDMQEQIFNFDLGRHVLRIPTPPRPMTEAEWQRLPEPMRAGLESLTTRHAHWMGVIAKAEEEAQPAYDFMGQLERNDSRFYDICTRQYWRLRYEQSN